MTKDELLVTHPTYDKYIADWLFHRDSYLGGSWYRDGHYLKQHPFESAENYGRRVETAYFYNYCSPIVDIFVSHLFKELPTRDFGSLANDDNTSFNQFMRDSQRFASYYGQVHIMVDKPAIDTRTQLEAQDNDIRPYLSIITPENLIDWEYTRLANGKQVLSMVKIQEGNNYRIWSQVDWELWTTDEDDAVLIDSGVHDLGIIPMVTLYNRKSHIKMVGLSDIQDIEDINKNIYYLCSDAKEIIENTAFPMLAQPYDKGTKEPQVVGPRNILQFDPTEVNSKPFWLEPPHSSLSEIRNWVGQDINEIFRIAKMGGVRATQNDTQSKSGIALKIENQQMAATLSEKADNIEQAEWDILSIWAMLEGKEFDGEIDYPDDFDYDNLSDDLDNAIKSQTIRVGSKTFEKERAKKVVDGLMPKLDEETRNIIFTEIDEGGLTDTDALKEKFNIGEPTSS
jgi:hypothetical protein